MRKTIILLIIALFLTGVYTAPAHAAANPPEILAESAILIDAKTGTVLYDKDMNVPKEPASTTKIITCLLALENLPLDKVVTIDAETPFTEGSRVYLEEGEQITVENLLYALMLESANDAAVALAKEISGSIDGFTALMEKRAGELGATNSTFKNPNGLHMEGHYSTAYDLAMIAKKAMQNEEFRKLVTTYKHTIPATNKQPERYLYNTNRLIYDEKTMVPVKGIMMPAKYADATGIKTGYTSHAGGCLVAGATRDGVDLIAVTLKSTDPGRFGDCIALLDYGFDNYYTHQAVDKNTAVDDIKVERGAVNHVGLAITEDRYITLPKEASLALISTKTVLDKSVKAPVKKGQEVGKIQILEGSDVIGEVPVVTVAEVAKGSILSVFGIPDAVASKIFIILIILVGLAAALTAAYIFLTVRYTRKRKAMRVKRAMEIAKERERKQQEMEQRRWPY